MFTKHFLQPSTAPITPHPPTARPVLIGSVFTVTAHGTTARRSENDSAVVVAAG